MLATWTAAGAVAWHAASIHDRPDKDWVEDVGGDLTGGIDQCIKRLRRRTRRLMRALAWNTPILPAGCTLVLTIHSAQQWSQVPVAPAPSSLWPETSLHFLATIASASGHRVSASQHLLVKVLEWTADQYPWMVHVRAPRLLSTPAVADGTSDSASSSSASSPSSSAPSSDSSLDTNPSAAAHTATSTSPRRSASEDRGGSAPTSAPSPPSTSLQSPTHALHHPLDLSFSAPICPSSIPLLYQRAPGHVTQPYQRLARSNPVSAFAVAHLPNLLLLLTTGSSHEVLIHRIIQLLTERSEWAPAVANALVRVASAGTVPRAHFVHPISGTPILIQDALGLTLHKCVHGNLRRHISMRALDPLWISAWVAQILVQLHIVQSTLGLCHNDLSLPNLLVEPAPLTTYVTGDWSLSLPLEERARIADLGYASLQLDGLELRRPDTHGAYLSEDEWGDRRTMLQGRRGADAQYMLHYLLKDVAEATYLSARTELPRIALLLLLLELTWHGAPCDGVEVVCARLDVSVQLLALAHDPETRSHAVWWGLGGLDSVTARWRARTALDIDPFSMVRFWTEGGVTPWMETLDRALSQWSRGRKGEFSRWLEDPHGIPQHHSGAHGPMLAHMVWGKWREVRDCMLQLRTILHGWRTPAIDGRERISIPPPPSIVPAKPVVDAFVAQVRAWCGIPGDDAPSLVGLRTPPVEVDNPLLIFGPLDP